MSLVLGLLVRCLIIQLGFTVNRGCCCYVRPSASISFDLGEKANLAAGRLLLSPIVPERWQ
jgi:hypothetical protein